MECVIRPWTFSDAGGLAKAMNNRNVLDNLRDGIPFPYTERDALDFIRGMLSADQNTAYAFAVAADGQLAGSISVTRQSNIHFRTAELGYFIAEPFWGRGVGTQAVRLTCDYIFQNTDILRIFVEPFARNAASCRVLEKAGFLYEGLLRKNAVKNGETLDMKLYSLLRDEID